MEAGFYWGSSSNSLTNHVVASVSGSTSGTFSASLTGLSEGQTVVYQAYVKVKGSGAHSDEEQVVYASGTKFFKMGSGSSIPAAGAGWLELPGRTEGSHYITNTLRAGGARNYTHLYDTEKCTSLWTAYPLYASAMGELKRPENWSYNPGIDEKYQVNLCGGSYTNYSRGHMIPNGSRNGIRAMQVQTFHVTNSVPQRQNKFNGSIWARLENALQGMATSSKDTVYIVTGVAFNKVGENKSISTTKAKNDSKVIPVPNYFYKVALKVKRSGQEITSASTVGVWMEHRDYNEGEEYDDFAVSVDQIEQWTGVDFFVNLPDAIENVVETNSSWSEFAKF